MHLDRVDPRGSVVFSYNVHTTFEFKGVIIVFFLVIFDILSKALFPAIFAPFFDRAIVDFAEMVDQIIYS
jgi:hypothetical protein